MSAKNHNLIHRPLRAGIAILNPIVNEIGTLGLIGTDAQGGRWVVSCYHVLCRFDLSPAPDGEAIFQPVDDLGNMIARTSITRADTNLDCAAAKVLDGIAVTGEVLNLPRIRGVRGPEVGERVMKSGCVSSVTEGVVSAIRGDEIEIRITGMHPRNCILTEPGDSGALWIHRDTVEAVALHRSGSAFGGALAKAARLSSVLRTLQLDPLFD